MAKKRPSRKKEDVEREESILLAEKRTHLAEIRTELAHERTIMSDLRTSSTIILFGVAFIGFSEEQWSFFYNAGITAVIMGIGFLLSALQRGSRHSKEIHNVKKFFNRLIRFKFIRSKEEQ